MVSCNRNSTTPTPTAVLSGRAVASGHLKNRQETVIINLFIRGASGKGPIRSTPMVCHTSPLTGRSMHAEVLSNFLYTVKEQIMGAPAFLEGGGGGGGGGGGEGRQL